MSHEVDREKYSCLSTLDRRSLDLDGIKRILEVTGELLRASIQHKLLIGDVELANTEVVLRNLPLRVSSHSPPDRVKENCFLSEPMSRTGIPY